MISEWDPLQVSIASPFAIADLLANSLSAAQLCSRRQAKPLWASQALPHKIVPISTFRFGSHTFCALTIPLIHYQSGK